MVKSLPAVRTRFPGWDYPPEKGTAIHSSIFAWEIPRTGRATVHEAA